MEVTVSRLEDVADDGYHSYTVFVRARQGALLRAAYLLTGDHHRAEDLLQGALVKLAENWGKVQHGYPEAFVRTVLYRDSVSWWRRHRRERLGPSPSALSWTKPTPWLFGCCWPRRSPD